VAKWVFQPAPGQFRNEGTWRTIEDLGLTDEDWQHLKTTQFLLTWEGGEPPAQPLLELDGQQSEEFARLLENPPAPNEELKKLMRRKGFLAGQLQVPADFDRMGVDEIAGAFEGTERPKQSEEFARQLTDDDIDSFIVRLVEYLERHPATFDKGDVSEEGYDRLSEFIRQQLEPFSNGHRNYN
jgi:Protein of unknown function (DUF1778)